MILLFFLLYFVLYCAMLYHSHPLLSQYIKVNKQTLLKLMFWSDPYELFCPISLDHGESLHEISWNCHYLCNAGKFFLLFSGINKNRWQL